MKKKKYVIVTPSFTLHSGGIIVLNKLCHILNEIGEEAYIAHLKTDNSEIFNTNPNYNTPIANNKIMEEDPIVLYPEIVYGNPLNAKHVVRWILNKPGVMGGDGIFGDDDMIFYFSEYFAPINESINILRIVEMHDDLFEDYGYKREGSCFAVHKGNRNNIINDLHDPRDEITDISPRQELVEIFNRKEIFYCYDSISFVSVVAALCGCTSVVIPDDKVNKEKWLKTRPYGIAFGLDDIDRAKQTMYKIRPWLEQINNNSIIQLKKFINITQSKVMKATKNKSLNGLIVAEKPLISIIIPVFNNLKYTKKCLIALEENTHYPKYEIIIVDNSSTDGTTEYLENIQKQNNKIKVITNKKNLGFARANNQGAKIAVGEYILCLNNDTEAHENWLAPMVDILEADSSVGAVGSKLLFSDGTIQHAGVAFFDDRPTGGDAFNPRHIYYGEDKDFSEANELRSYQTLTAACLLIRKQIFDDLKGFDEKFWNGYEDIDLCLRMREKGYKLIYQPDSVLIHHESKSGPERFSKLQANIDLLNKKWIHKIVHDVVKSKNGKLQLGDNHQIRHYKMPVNSVEQLARRPLVSIIMLTYNALDYTKKCVDSIIKNTKYPYEIVFVDNASTDGTVKYLRKLVKKHNNFQLIENKKNIGFAAGNNQGIEAANGKYVMLLNNDVLVSEGWLGRLVESIEKDEKIGAVGPITNSISGRQMVPPEKIPYDEDEGFYQFSQQLYWQNRGHVAPRRRLAGFAILMEKTLYQEVGGLDEDFGVGNFEDDDLSLKIRGEGYALMVDNSVFIHHYGSQSFIANKIDYIGNMKERLLLFQKKWPDVDYEELIEIKNPLREEEKQQLEFASGFLERGAMENAKELFTKVLRMNPLSEDALFGLSLCACQEGDKETALKYLNTVLSLNPNHADALNQTGLIAAENGDLKNAQSLFITAIEKDPNFIDAQRNLAESLLIIEEYDHGVQMYLSILEKNPNDTPTLLRMAQLNKEAGNEQDAKEWADKVISIEPENCAAQAIAQS